MKARVLISAVALAVAVPIGATSVSTPTAGATGLTGDGAPAAAAAPVPASEPSAWERALGRQPSDSAAPAEASAAVAAITVVPSTDLVSGQTVDITGTGFASGDLAVAQCRAAPTGPESCDLRTVKFISPNAAGEVSTTLVVSRTLLVGGAVVQCEDAVGTCTLIVTNIDSSGIDASAPLGFNPDLPRPSPQLIASPAVDLVDGQTVTVSGSGFRPGSTIVVRQCSAGLPFCGDIGHFVSASTSGEFSVAKHARLRTLGPSGEFTTCLVIDCVFYAMDIGDLEYVASVEVAFDPDQSPPSDPTITVTPNSGLRHDDTVDVVGIGFDPNSYVEITQCPQTDVGICLDYLADVETDSAGAFSVAVSVSRLVSIYDFATSGPVVLDCAVVQCSVFATEYESEVFLRASAPIAFDASVPPPPLPIVSAAPLEHLPYRANVIVTGTGFAPNAEVYGEFCAEGLDFGTCRGSGFATADSSGAVTFPIAVRRISAGIPELGIDPIDCVDAQVDCSIQVYGERSYEQFTFAVTFDPNAPIPPPPTATVSPSTDLGYRDTVAVRGSGFLPGSVPVQQCATVRFPEPVPFEFEACSGLATVEADADGRIADSTNVRRTLHFGFESTDCATALSPCFLRIGGDEFGEHVDVPLGFDPTSVAPPPPRVKVSPRTHLRDGEVVAVRGSGFSPNADLAILVCLGDVLAIENCDFRNPQFAAADAEGRIATSASVRSQFEGFFGPVECATGAGVCSLLVVNLFDLLEASFTPLSFGPWVDVHGIKVTEGTGANTLAPVVVDLSEPTNRPVDVFWRTVAGTATAGVDFIPIEGVVTIPAGATEAVFPAEVLGDSVDEPTETFRVEVTGVAGAVIADDSATVKIRDDDDEPEFSIGDVTVGEGDGLAKVEVLLSAPSGRALRVEYRTHDESARSGSDFVRKRRGLKFAPGETRHVIRIELVDDRLPERTERLRVTLDDVATSRITITDDD